MASDWIYLHGSDGHELVIKKEDIIRLYTTQTNGDRVHVIHTIYNDHWHLGQECWEELRDQLLSAVP